MESATQHSPRSTIEVEQHVRQLNDEWVKAIVRADAEVLDRILADDFFFTYPLEGDDKAQFSREQLSVRVFGTSAVLTARDSVTWLYHGRQMSGKYKIMSVYTERRGRWQMCAMQACPM